MQTVLAFFILGKRDAFELRLSHVPMYLFLFFLKSKVAQFVGNSKKSILEMVHYYTQIVLVLDKIIMLSQFLVETT